MSTKEILCENCLDASNYDGALIDGLCSDCYAEIKYQLDHFDN